jgi:hypothetical protein
MFLAVNCQKIALFRGGWCCFNITFHLQLSHISHKIGIPNEFLLKSPSLKWSAEQQLAAPSCGCIYFPLLAWISYLQMPHLERHREQVSPICRMLEHRLGCCDTSRVQQHLPHPIPDPALLTTWSALTDSLACSGLTRTV